jgi:hypothetical protein
MSPQKEFLRHANECEQMARPTRDPESRMSWNRLAERWPLRIKNRTRQCGGAQTCAAEKVPRQHRAGLGADLNATSAARLLLHCLGRRIDYRSQCFLNLRPAREPKKPAPETPQDGGGAPELNLSARATAGARRQKPPVGKAPQVLRGGLPSRAYRRCRVRPPANLRDAERRNPQP